MKRMIIAATVAVAAALPATAAVAEVDTAPVFSQIETTTVERNCTRAHDPWTAVAAKVRLRGSDEWVRIAPLTDAIRKQIIQQRAQSMLEAKWCLR